MKKIAYVFSLSVVCAVMMISALGCKAKPQLGETAAEVRRRHQRIEAIREMQMRNDIDAFFHKDRPSRLSDVRIP